MHVEGTIGELIDGVMEWLERELGVVQVSKRGTMVDELDFPAEALREAISNALIHRSLGPISESTTRHAGKQGRRRCSLPSAQRDSPQSPYAANSTLMRLRIDGQVSRPTPTSIAS